MKCPLCQVDLLVAERQGVEIDHCPRCRGVWLDRGELDKILDRTYAAPPAYASPPPPQYGTVHSGPRYDDDDDRKRHGYGHGHPHRKKRGFLDDLFDFD